MKNIYFSKHNCNYAFISFFLILFALSAHAQQSYTFTTCGATGAAGPTQLQVTNTYSSTNLNGMVGVQNGIQTWTVPLTGNYRIEAFGAAGGNVGGLGARMTGDFALAGGTVIKILVGQQGLFASSSSNNGGGGGGGTFVMTGTATPLVIAGGGGGFTSVYQNYIATFSASISDGRIIQAGGSTDSNGGGTNGNGGNWGTTDCCMANSKGASGGGGLLTNGGIGATGGPGLAFINGGGGGAGNPNGLGGFGGGGGCSYDNAVRSGGGGGYSGGQGGTFTYPSPVAYCHGGGGGSYNAGTNQNNAAGINSGQGRVIITELCNISLNASSNPICAGTSVTLTTNAVSNYSWSNGSTASSVVITPSATTAYSLTGTSSLNCVAGSNVILTVHQGVPALSITNSSNNICPGQSTTISASGAVSYTWTGGITNGAQITPTTSTSYTVTGANSCGTSTAATSVSVHPTPTVTAVVSTPSVCSGNSATLVASGAGSYSWTNGPATAQYLIFPSSTSAFTVTGFSAIGCSATAVASIVVVQTPTNIALASPPLICIGATSTFSTSGAGSYTWTWPGGSDNQPSFVMTPTTAPAVIVATVSKSNSNCVNTQTVQLIVNQLPFIQTIATPTLICAGKPANLTAAGALGYTWNPGSTSGQSITVFPPVTTDYTVTASDGTCVNTAVQTISVNPNPTITISPSSSVICQHDTVIMTLNGATGYTWMAPPILFGSNASTVKVSPLSNTTYSILGVNIHTCYSGTTQSITVNPTPTLNTFVNNPLVCTGGTSTISATGANSYSWSNGAGTSVTVVNPASTSVYTVTGFYDNTGCKSQKTATVSVFSPSFQVPASASACIGGTVTLTASGADTYTWNGNQPFQSIAVTPSVYTVYQVAATSSSLGPNGPVSCISSKTVGVSIYLNPTITAIATRSTICRFESVDLVGQGGATYTWSTLQQGSLVTVQPPPTGQVTYTVLGVDSAGCKGTASVLVKILTCTGIGENAEPERTLKVYPNPASGAFYIETNYQSTLIVTNTLGQLLHTFDVGSNNNFKAMVSGLAPGVYFVTDINGDVTKKIVVQ